MGLPNSQNIITMRPIPVVVRDLQVQDTWTQKMKSIIGLVAWLTVAGLFEVAGAPAVLASEAPTLAVSGPGIGERRIGLDELKRLGGTELRTSTPFTEGVKVFAGITGSQFVKATGVTGRDVHAEAVNGYKVVIPWAVFATDTLLIAYERDGKPMAVRDKGPFWIVFPFDAGPEFRTDTYKSYAIWSITRFEFQ